MVIIRHRFMDNVKVKNMSFVKVKSINGLGYFNHGSNDGEAVRNQSYTRGEAVDYHLPSKIAGLSYGGNTEITL